MDRPENFEKYIDDLLLIKRTLMDNEERSVIENWAFFTWAGLILVGTIVNYLLFNFNNFSFHDSFVIIWIPVLLLGGSLETLAFFNLLKKVGKQGFAPRITKYYYALGGASLGLLGVYYQLILHNVLSPGSILLGISIAFFLLTIISYQILFATASFLGLVGLFLVFMDVQGPIYFVSAGVLSSLAFFTAGVQSYFAERRKDG